MSNKQIVQRYTDTKKNNSISICDLLKNNTTKIIRKYETQGLQEIEPVEFALIGNDHNIEFCHNEILC